MSGSNSSPPVETPAAPDKPLGLTVYDLPSPQDSAAVDAGRTARGRIRMLAVLLVCAAPVIASYFTYYVVRPEGRRNYGELVQPQRPLPALAATQQDGQTTPLTALKGQWLLVSVSGAGCDAACAKHLYLQRQLREALGKDKDRLDRVWLITDSAPLAPGVQAALASSTVLRVDATALAQWLQPAAGRQLSDHLYLVDPLGNWMMRFPAIDFAISPVDTVSAAKIKRDLERLMRAAASWDTAGRP